MKLTFTFEIYNSHLHMFVFLSLSLVAALSSSLGDVFFLLEPYVGGGNCTELNDVYERLQVTILSMKSLSCPSVYPNPSCTYWKDGVAGWSNPNVVYVNFVLNSLATSSMCFSKKCRCDSSPSNCISDSKICLIFCEMFSHLWLGSTLVEESME